MEDVERQEGRCRREVLVLTGGSECIGQLDQVVDYVGIKMSRQYLELLHTQISELSRPTWGLL